MDSYYADVLRHTFPQLSSHINAAFLYLTTPHSPSVQSIQNHFDHSQNIVPVSLQDLLEKQQIPGRAIYDGAFSIAPSMTNDATYAQWSSALEQISQRLSPRGKLLLELPGGSDISAFRDILGKNDYRSTYTKQQTPARDVWRIIAKPSGQLSIPYR